MKTVKYLTSFILIFIVFIFIGEIYVWHLDSFETNYSYVTFFLQSNTTQDEMIYDISNASKKENVEVFVIDKKVDSLFSERIDIYGTDGVKQYLLQNSEIKTGKYSSIFLGKINVVFHPFENIEDITKFENYYLIGDSTDNVEFKKDLIDKYAGKFPQSGYYSINSILSISIIWIIVLLLLLLMTLYETALLKKEVIVRIILGEQLIYFVIKQMVFDILFYFIAYQSIKGILINFTYVSFYKSVSYICMVVFFVLNSIIYLSLLFTNYKKDIQTKRDAHNILKISYFYKMLTIFFTVIVMAGAIELIFNGISYYKQKKFFEDRQDYSYITYGSDDYEEISNLMKDTYKLAMEEQKEISIVDLSDWGDGLEYILADTGAVNYLKSQILSLNDTILDDELYFIIPEKYEGNNEIIEHIKEVWSAYYNYDYNYKIITYNNSAEIVTISNIGKIQSTIKKNPIIILNNMSSESLDNYINLLYIGNSTMYNISNNDWLSLIEKYNSKELLYYSTNVYENYIYYWEITKRNMLIGIILFTILLALEGCVLRTILKYEYNVNAKELSLSKIFGSNILSRHKKILITSGASGLASLLGAVIICAVLEFSSVFYIVVGGILVLIVEFLLVISYIQKLDRVNICKIFKGGNL